MFGFSFWEIGLILVVALIVLGPKRLPALAKTIGKGLRELRRASSDLREAIEEPLEEVRKPLQDMRDDLMETVHNIEREVQQEIDEVQQVAHDDDPYADPYAEHEAERTEEIEIEDHRRKIVEDLYASYDEEDATGDTAASADPAAEEPVVDATKSGRDDTAKVDVGTASSEAAWDDSAWDDTTWDEEDEGGAAQPDRDSAADPAEGASAKAPTAPKTEAQGGAGKSGEGERQDDA
jgi:sec-independent protein translocase protein TatB